MERLLVVSVGSKPDTHTIRQPQYLSLYTYEHIYYMLLFWCHNSALLSEESGINGTRAISQSKVSAVRGTADYNKVEDSFSSLWKSEMSHTFFDLELTKSQNLEISMNQNCTLLPKHQMTWVI